VREYRLFPRQAEAERPLLAGSFVLNWDMRLGKTRACLHAFDRLWQTGGPKVCIVVCPSIAKGVWWHEQLIEMGLQLPTIKLDGTVNKRATGERIHGLPLLVIVNWEIVDAHLPELLELVQRERVVLILDETHEHCCNPRNARYKAVKDLAMLADRVWPLTGTLYRTSAMDYYWQLRLLGPTFPFYYTKIKDFGERFSFPKYNRYSKRDEYKGLRNEGELLAACAHLIDRRLEELEEVPAEQVWWLDEGERWRYAGGDDQGAMSKARAELSELKATRTIEYVKRIRRAGEPMVVFGWHKRFTHRVATELGGVLIDGDTSEANKTQRIADFTAGAVDVVVVNIKSGGVAIDLARARHAVFGEVDWVAANMAQAEARIRGPKQKHRVSYTYVLCADSVDEFVWRTMLKRGRDQQRLDSHLLTV